jgi:hypothetical protein
MPYDECDGDSDVGAMSEKRREMKNPPPVGFLNVGLPNGACACVVDMDC